MRKQPPWARDFGRTDTGRFYYAMEFLEGMDLQRLVERFGPASLSRGVRPRSVLASLGEAHQRGILHRDIKPGNILLGVRGAQYDFVKVLDFGLVKQIAAPVVDGRVSLTGENSIMGSLATAGLIGVNRGSVAWGDYDGDGDLDILLTGCTDPDLCSMDVAKVYRNDGGGTFTDISAALEKAGAGSAAWGDYDNDGDLDILLTGEDSEVGRISKVYRNDAGAFTDIGAALEPVYVSSVAWGDYDNDGDLDILLTGENGQTGETAKLYRNDGGGDFVDTDASLQGVFRSAVAWGDYDNDGDLDILLAGKTNGPTTSKIYRNDGGGSFTDISAALAAMDGASLAWGDFDNDGDLDILIAGQSSTGQTLKVYRNDGGTFVDIAATLTGGYWSSVSWGDYDGDGDLDILVIGFNGSSNIAKVFRNNVGTANTMPSAPAGLSSSVDGDAVTLSWTASSDTQTAATGLTYNVRVGTASGLVDVMPPMALPTLGGRLIPALGNAQHGLTAALENLSPGTYSWSVQAIDAAFEGSSFASEESFVVAPTSTATATATATATPTATSTLTETPTSSPEPSLTPTETPTASATPTGTPIVTANSRGGPTGGWVLALGLLLLLLRRRVAGAER